MYDDQGIADQEGDGCKGGIGGVQPGLFVRCAARAGVVPLYAFRVVADVGDPIVSIQVFVNQRVVVKSNLFTNTVKILIILPVREDVGTIEGDKQSDNNLHYGQDHFSLLELFKVKHLP